MIIIKKIEQKSVVWFLNSNQYLIVENIVAQLFQLLEKQASKLELISYIVQKINVPEEQAQHFLSDTEVLYNTLHKKSKKQNNKEATIPSFFQVSKYYQYNDITFQIDYASEYEMYLVHPKFAHFEITEKTILNTSYHYQIFTEGKTIYFYINQELVGSWPKNEVHFFQGKCSMKLVEQLYQKPEEEWLGVFHASAITDGNSSILLLGDSGNGKSTALALLQAHGLHCLADDFVPIAASTQKAHHFPAAISIKKNSLSTLLPIYPELSTSAEYHFKRLGKIVRYLPPKTSKIKQASCKALIFIKYDEKIDLKVEKLSNLAALEQLIPDSWLSSVPENVKNFLNWFEHLPCYQLTYGNNAKMLTTVSKIFANEL